VREHVFVHDSNHKGNVAEAEIAAAGVNLGIPVLRPVAEHGRYDLAFELGNKPTRKTRSIFSRCTAASWIVATCYQLEWWRECEVFISA
jgi:hypothetical protein